jgi:hypothetical protein
LHFIKLINKLLICFLQVNNGFDSHLKPIGVSFLSSDSGILGLANLENPTLVGQFDVRDAQFLSSEMIENLCLQLPKGVQLVFATYFCFSRSLFERWNILPSMLRPWEKRDYFTDMFFEDDRVEIAPELAAKEVLAFASSKPHQLSYTKRIVPIHELDEDLPHICTCFASLLLMPLQFSSVGMLNTKLINWLETFFSCGHFLGPIDQLPPLHYLKHPGSSRFLGGRPQV